MDHIESAPFPSRSENGIEPQALECQMCSDIVLSAISRASQGFSLTSRHLPLRLLRVPDIAFAETLIVSIASEGARKSKCVRETLVYETLSKMSVNHRVSCFRTPSLLSTVTISLKNIGCCILALAGTTESSPGISPLARSDLPESAPLGPETQTISLRSAKGLAAGHGSGASWGSTVGTATGGG
jgi:hypothetical protein